MYSVPLFLKRECDRTLGGRGRQARTAHPAAGALHEPQVPTNRPANQLFDQPANCLTDQPEPLIAMAPQARAHARHGAAARLPRPPRRLGALQARVGADADLTLLVCAACRACVLVCATALLYYVCDV
jgi:ferredoxin